MAAWRGRHGASRWAALAILMATACSGDTHDVPGAAGRAPDGAATEPAQARAVVDALRDRLWPVHPRTLAPSPAARIEARGGRLVPVFSVDPAQSGAHRAQVT